jgi:hypothetical protein
LDDYQLIEGLDRAEYCEWEAREAIEEVVEVGDDERVKSDEW